MKNSVVRKKIISYSLWGSNPKYTEGAVTNALQAVDIYPGWTPRFYCGASVPHRICERLRQAGAEVVCVDGANDNRGMFWRFRALAEPDVERVIFRDTDSRLTLRERSAVQEWEQSGLAGHIMRDHLYHGMPIMGGMWGAVGGVFCDIEAWMQQFAPSVSYNQDQRFLASFVYPVLMSLGCCIHDEFYRYEKAARAFPTARQGHEFVGEAFSAEGEREEHWKVLRDYQQSLRKRMKFFTKRLLLLMRHAAFVRCGAARYLR